MRAIVLERNKLVNRRLVRFFHCAGYEAVGVEDPAALDAQVDGAFLLGADAFDADLVAQTLRSRPHMRGVLWTAEPLDRSLRHVIDSAQISNILGRPDFESTPRDWELMMVARRLARPDDAGPPFASYLSWGFTGFQERVPTTAARDELVGKVQGFVGRIGAPKRVAELFGELAHELMMNAMFDAPIDGDGRVKYALDRKAQLALPEPEQPVLRVATDGARLVLQVIDPFGRLERRHVFSGLARGLRGGEMDSSQGGAGLGMVVCHNSTVAMFYDVARGKRTEATGVFELDLNLREFRTQARSLHYFQS